MAEWGTDGKGAASLKYVDMGECSQYELEYGVARVMMSLLMGLWLLRTVSVETELCA